MLKLTIDELNSFIDEKIVTLLSHEIAYLQELEVRPEGVTYKAELQVILPDSPLISLHNLNIIVHSGGIRYVSPDRGIWASDAFNADAITSHAEYEELMELATNLFDQIVQEMEQRELIKII